MHYDETEPLSCDAGDGGVGMRIRVWMPIFEVDRAPLLLANTTRLYDDACQRLESPSDVNIHTPSNRILSASQHRHDCDQVQGACDYFHTLGMRPGDMIIFRNNLVLHGTMRWGRGVRLALAVDCTMHDESGGQ